MNENNLVEILMIEDSAEDAELALRALKENKIVNAIHLIKDGAEALDFIFCSGKYAGRDFKSPPKIILLDLKLPKVDGIEILRRIKSDERTKIIPVIVLTSSKEETDIIMSYKLGVNSYIVKPVNFEKFVVVMKNLELYWLLTNKSPV